MGSALYNFLISFIGFVGTAILILFGYLALIYWHNAYLPQIRKTFQFQWDSIRKRQQKLVDTFLSGEVFQTAEDRKSTRLNSSHVAISYAVFCLKKNNK